MLLFARTPEGLRNAATCNQMNAVGRKIHTVEWKYTSGETGPELIPDFGDGSKSARRTQKNRQNLIASHFQPV